jgi:Rrf2 family protein
MTMKLSTKGRYATRALVDIALHKGERSVLLRDIAQRQNISTLYLKRLIAPLVAAGIIRSNRGAGGGVSLGKPAHEITISNVIQLLEGVTAPVDCVINPESCARSDSCVTRDIWRDMKNAIDNVLGNITVQNLVEKHKTREQPAKPMYHI